MELARLACSSLDGPHSITKAAYINGFTFAAGSAKNYLSAPLDASFSGFIGGAIIGGCGYVLEEFFCPESLRPFIAAAFWGSSVYCMVQNTRRGKKTLISETADLIETRSKSQAKSR